MFGENDINGAIISLYIALAIVFIGSIYIASQSIKVRQLLSKNERFTLIWCIIFIFIVIASLIVKVGFDWTICLLQNSKVGTPSLQTDTDIYNTRSLLGYVEGIFVTEIGIFLSLLILMWTSTQNKLMDIKKYLIEQKGAVIEKRLNVEVLDGLIKTFQVNSSKIQEASNDLKPWYYTTISLIVIYVSSLGISNFSNINIDVLYPVIIWQKVIAILFLLWFFTLLTIHQLVINYH